MTYRIIAHRGASAYEPENTLRAFRRAMQLGAHMSELDLHLSQDGELIVMHNATVEHTTNGHGAIADMTLADLKRLDAGHGERIPTLQDVIDLTRGRHGLYIELKGEGTSEPTADTLRANRLTDAASAIVGSFKPELVRAVKEHAPEITTSLLVGPVYPAEQLIALCRNAKADMVHLCWENRAPQPHQLVTPDLLRALREAGLGIVLWHEERDEELRALNEMDVDGICTNTPEKLARLQSGAAGVLANTHTSTDRVGTAVRPPLHSQYTSANILIHPEPPSADPDLITGVTPAQAGWEYISFQARRLAKGKTWSFQTGENEAAVVDLCGTFSVTSNRGEWQHIGGRENVFTAAAHALYLPRRTDFTLTAESDCEFAVTWVPTDRNHEPYLTKPSQVPISIRGGDNVSRQINDILPPGSPVHRLVLVEVYTPSGNWSSYPPHKHDVHREDAQGDLLEADLEEVYFYKFDKPAGYAYQRVYTDAQSPLHRAGCAIDALVRPENNCVVLIPEGYHPVAGAPGHTTYYLNVLAGSAQSLANVDDPNYSWVKNSYTTKDARLPLY